MYTKPGIYKLIFSCDYLRTAPVAKSDNKIGYIKPGDFILVLEKHSEYNTNYSKCWFKCFHEGKICYFVSAPLFFTKDF